MSEDVNAYNFLKDFDKSNIVLSASFHYVHKKKNKP